MITFHFPLAEDEHFYSYIAALFQRSAWSDPRDFLKALIANAGPCADQNNYSGFTTQLIPSVLRGLVGTVLNEDQLRPDQLNILTLLPYYRPFLAPIQQQCLYKEASFSFTSRRDRVKCLPQESGNRFRYCESCMSAAYESFGRAVLLRAHQLPCVYVCWTHHEPLILVEIDVDNLSIPDFRVSREKCVKKVSEEYLWLASESRTLLHLNRGFTDPLEKIHAMYSYEAQDFQVMKSTTIVPRENARPKLRKGRRVDSWDAGWSRSVVEDVRNELASYSDELWGIYDSSRTDNYNLDRTAAVGSPIEHLMRIRRFEGGVGEFFRKVDEVSMLCIEKFFPLAYRRHGHEIVQCSVAVTSKVGAYIKKMALHLETNLGASVDMICSTYRNRLGQPRVADQEMLPRKRGLRSKTAVLPMSVDSFVFIDRLASRKGNANFAMTLEHIVECVAKL